MTIQPRASVRRLASARAISFTGGAAAYVALTFTIYERTGSAAWLSATLIATFGVEGLVGPFAGVLGDRFDRRRLMIASDLAGAAVFAAMAFAHAPVFLVGLALLSAVVEAPFLAASQAAIPNLVGEDDLTWANSLIGVGRNLGITLGPALGGVLLKAFGAPWVFGLNALSFVFSALLVWTVRAPFAERGKPGQLAARAAGGVRAGFRYLFSEPVLRRLAIGAIVFVLGLAMVLVADAPVVQQFGAGSVGLGLIIGCWGAGSVLGSFLSRGLEARHEQPAVVLGLAGMGVTLVAAGVSPWFWPILVTVFLNGVADAITLVAEQGIRQRRTPDELRARVSSASDAGWQTAQMLSFALAGTALNLVGPQGLYTIGGISALLASLVVLPIVRVPAVAARPAEPGRAP
jgi:MFS family permease